MNKTIVDEMVRHMKAGGMVTKAAPWMVEGFGEKALNVRYIGLKISGDWLDIFSPQDNLLLKFITGRNDAYLEFYIANTSRFLKITQTKFTPNSKWETLLGEFRNRLKKDKSEYLTHNTKVGNLYSLIKPHLKQ